MKPTILAVLLLNWLIALAGGSQAKADGRGDIVTSVVSASLDSSYHRKKNKDGSFVAEYYVLSYGGQAKGTISHPSIDGVPLARFEALIKDQLAKRNYLIAPDAPSADLFIHVLWGMTDPLPDTTSVGIARDNASKALATFRSSISDLPRDTRGGFGVPALSPEQLAAEGEAESAFLQMMLLQRARSLALTPTGRLLGYIDAVNDLTDNPAIHAGLGTSYSDMWEEVADQRFYIVITAYDFKVIVGQKKLKPLWVTRVSIRARDSKFDEQLTAMLNRAGMYFGRRTRGLARTVEGRVDLGETEVVGVVPDSPEPAAPPEKTSAER